VLTLPTATVDLDGLRVFRDGTEDRLSAQEGRLLEVLAAHDGATVSRDVLLQDAMGISPKVVTRALDAAISRLRAKIEPTPRRPKSLLSVRGRGYRLVVVDHAQGPPPLPESVRDGVVGRDEETQQGLGLLATHGVLLLLGPGGVGKTTLADRLLARRLGRPATDRRIDLSAVVHAVDLLPALGLGLGLEDEATADRIAVALASPAEPWVLDNLEQLDTDALAQLRPLVEGSRAPLVLTSRRPPWDGLPTLELRGLTGENACRVLLRSAQRVCVGALPPVDAVQGLADAVDGLPLALELVGAQLPRLGVPALERAVADPATLHLGDGRDGRHASLHRVVAASWARLPPEVQRTLCWWSAFHGPFDRRDAEGLLPPGAPPLLAVLDILTRASLVVMEDDHVVPWSVVRAFAAEQLDPQQRAQRDEVLARHLTARCPRLQWHEETVRRAHQDWVWGRRRALLEIGATLAPADRARVALSMLMVGHRLPPSTRSRLGAQALEAARQAGDAVLEVEAVLAQTRLGHWAGTAAAAVSVFQSLEEALQQVPDPLRLHATYVHGLYLRRCGRIDEALEVQRRGAEDAMEAGHPSPAARMRQEVGVIHRRLGHLDEAFRYLSEALALHRALDEPRFEAGCHVSLASIRRQQGRVADAIAHAERAVVLARPLDRPMLLANALNNLANVQAQEGLPEAGASLEASVAISRAQGDRPGLCVSIGGLGMLHDQQGRTLDAELAYQEARTHAVLAGYPGRAAFWTYRLADVAHRRGELDEAERRYRAGIDGLEQVQSPHAPRARAMLALLVAERGRTDESRALLEAIALLADGEEDDRIILAVARSGVARWSGHPMPDAAFDELGVQRAALHRPLYFVTRALYERAPGAVGGQ